MLTKKVDDILNSVTQLRPLPSNAARILKELDNPKINMGSLSEYVGLDQALTSLVLQTANSATLSYKSNCTSLRAAVIRIGIRRLKSILLAYPFIGSFDQKLRGYRLGSGELWHHSLATAIVSEWLAKALSLSSIMEEAYIAGLLHDFGKLFLDQYVLEDYTKITDFIQKYELPLWQVEEKLIGVDHAMVGGLIAERWDFPIILVDSIRYHHRPGWAKDNPTIPAIVNLANSFTSETCLTNSELFSSEIDPETYLILRLTDEKIEQLKIDALKIITFTNT